jgi:Tol biopolymer transport system component
MNADGTNVTDLGRGSILCGRPTERRSRTATAVSRSIDIWIMDADGGNKHQITQNYLSYAPAWSPDGSKIAFASYHEGRIISMS